MDDAPPDSQPSALLGTEDMMKKRVSEHIQMLRSKGAVPLVTADTGLVQPSLEEAYSIPVSDNLSLQKYCYIYL
jgi:hypothetical protein